MALIPIMGQPVNLVPNNERAFGCEPENSFCALYNKIDTERIMLQMVQTPCGTSLVGNGNFLNDSDWTYDANVVIEPNPTTGGKATHVVGTSGEIYQDIYSAYALLDYFSIFFTVSGMSAGSIAVHVGSTAATFTITENGIYQKYWFPPFNNTELKFVFSADCDGSISFISSYKLLNEAEITAILTDSNGSIVGNFFLEMLDEFVCFFINTLTIAEGCYNAVVTDPCVSGTELTEAFLNFDFETTDDWTLQTNSGSVLIPPDWFQATTGAITPAFATASQPFTIPVFNDLYVEFDLRVFDVGGANVNMGVFFYDGGNYYEAVRHNNVSPSTTYRTSAIITSAILNSGWLDMGVFIEDTSGNSGVTSSILYASVKYRLASQVDGVYTSNCLKIQSDVGNTKIVEGFADEINAYPVPNRSLGFIFHSDFFWLRARLDVSFSNPHSVIKTENNLYSSGTSKKTYAQLTKVWDLTFVEADENMHDTISNIINCDRFLIEGHEYITDEKEYQPNWNAKSALDTTDAKVEVAKVGGTRFNTNV